MKTYKNKQGLELQVRIDDNSGDIYPVMGGMDTSIGWKEYLEQYKREYRGHFRLIRKAIIDLGWRNECANNIANYYSFKFSDDIIIAFSWRAWGDLLCAINNERGVHYGYMKYYMS